MKNSEVGFRRARIVLLVAFTTILLTLVYLGVTVPEIRSFPAYLDRAPITIHGDSELDAGNGVTGGSGTESDPYIIEGWEIGYQSMNGIEITDSSAHVIIRNVAVYGSYRYSSEVPDGIVLRNSSNIVIESAYISGTFNGVLVKDAKSLEPNSVEIRQCTMSRCWSNIYLMNSSNCLVDRNVIRDAAYSNVVVDHCLSTLISDNEVTRSGSYTTVENALSSGIAVLESTNITLRGNDLSGGYYDDERIEVTRCHDVVITENEIGIAWARTVEIVDSSDIQLNNNSCYGAGTLFVTGSQRCEIAYNDLSLGEYGGISVNSSSQVRVFRNNIQAAGSIRTQLTTDSVIDENIISNSTATAMSIEGTNLTISRNLLTNNHAGIGLRGSYIKVDGNIISNSEVAYPGYYDSGIQGYGATNLTILNNSIQVNRSTLGMSLSYCSSVWIGGCNISGNLEFYSVNRLNISDNRIEGDRLVLNSYSYIPVEILHNSMIEVRIWDSTETATTIWDDGYPDGGNYWSNYTGVDEKSGPGQNQPGADGIGDTPQLITDKSSDQYPLMTPVVQDDTTPPVTKLTLAGTGGDRRWFLSEVNCTFVAQDNLAGVKTVHYRLDAGPWTNYTSQVSVSGDGEHLLEFYAEDWAGSTEPVRTRTIRIDKDVPQMQESQQTGLRLKNTRLTTIHYEFQDAMSGMLDYALIRSGYGYEEQGFTTITFAQLSLEDGTTTYYALAQDLAGNVNTSAAVDLVVSLNENRSPSSLGGPYGPWYDVGLLVDFILLLFMIWLSLVILYGPVSRHREPNEIDKEEVVDGYPKFKRRV